MIAEIKGWATAVKRSLGVIVTGVYDMKLKLAEMAETQKKIEELLKPPVKARVGSKRGKRDSGTLYNYDKKPGISLDFKTFKGRVLAGSYRNYPGGLPGVKLAPEIDKRCDVLIPIPDFSVPKDSDMEAGLIKALILLKGGGAIYVGCMGGQGRTGIFLAIMKRLEQVVQGDTEVDAIVWVRQQYSKHAVETAEQEKYVREFPLADLYQMFKDAGVIG